MTAIHRAIRQEELLRHLGWVQGLALRLVRDTEQARDVTQEVFRAALEHPPRQGCSGPGLRAWLRSATRFLAGKAQRSKRRQAAREFRASRHEATPSTLDVVARNAVIQRVSQSVMSLYEPYRSTILFRYLDGMRPGDIAAKMEVPAATVRKRLSRGLVLLRTRLKEQGIDGSSLGALLVLPAKGGLAMVKLSTVGGIGIMFSKATVVSGAAVLAGAGVLWGVTALPQAAPAPEFSRGVATVGVSSIEPQDPPVRRTAPVEARRALEPQPTIKPGPPERMPRAVPAEAQTDQALAVLLAEYEEERQRAIQAEMDLAAWNRAKVRLPDGFHWRSRREYTAAPCSLPCSRAWPSD